MKTSYARTCSACGVTVVATQRLAAQAVAVICLTMSILPCFGQGGVTAPRIRDLSVVQGTNTKTLRMWISTQAGVNYIAEYKNQLVPGAWLPLTDFPGSGGSDMITDTIGEGIGRFYRVAADGRPWVRRHPVSRNAQAGDTIQLDVVATGMLPLAYQWYGPNGVLTNGGRIGGSTSANLLIFNLDPSDEGNYWAVVTNSLGSTSCIPAGVRITLSQAPRILIDPQGQTLLVGQTLSLWSSANGAQPLNYKWFGPGGILADGGRISGSATTNLTVTGVEIADDGNYFMVVSNAFGVATSAVATVRVQLGIPPRITTNPQSQTVVAGQTVNLSVTATGTGTLYYQWHGPSGALSDGGKISGATTPNLVISNFQSSEDGNYYVVVTNAFGSATSAIANVRVQ